MVSDVVRGRAANELYPCQLTVVPGGELGSASQRLLRPVVVRPQELDPADLAPAGCRHVRPAGILREERALVERRRALLIRAVDWSVDQRTAQRNQCPRQKGRVVDVPGRRDGTA